MPDDSAHRLRIRYEYHQDPHARLNYAHGVWGGINSQGEVEMSFYTESDKLPPFSERAIGQDGEMGPETMPHDESLKVITRHIHSKVILNYHTAKAILEWLEDKIDTLEAEDADTALFSEGKTFHQ